MAHVAAFAQLIFAFFYFLKREALTHLFVVSINNLCLPQKLYFGTIANNIKAKFYHWGKKKAFLGPIKFYNL